MKTNRHSPLWTTCWLLVLTAGCVTLTHDRGQGPVCAVHGIPLEVGLAPIRYGLFAIDPEYEKRKDREFPNSNSFILGGCICGGKTVDVVAYCPECRKAEPVAQMRPVLSDGALDRAYYIGTIHVRVLFVQFPLVATDRLLREERLTADALFTLLRQGKGEVLAAPSVVTPIGQEAEVKSVVHVRYPSKFRLADANSVTNPPPASQSFGLIPESFEEREVGVQFRVLPDETEDVRIVNLTVTAEFDYHPEWHTNRMSISGVGDGNIDITFQQPSFQALSTSTTVTAPFGQTVLIGGGAPSKDKDCLTYILVSVNPVEASQDETLSNKASDATVEPAPGAASSSHQR